MPEDDFKARIASAQANGREVVWVTVEQTRNEAREAMGRMEEADLARRAALETLLDQPIRAHLVRVIEDDGTHHMTVVKDEEFGELVCLVVKLPKVEV
jgi:hypothetical protein